MKKIEKHPQQKRIRFSKETSWAWFKDTATQRPIIYVLGVDSFDKALPWWHEFVGTKDLDEAQGQFAGMHVELRSEDICVGSVIFISTPNPAFVAHELMHAVLRHLKYHNIDDEETHATFMSGWMEIFGNTFGWIEQNSTRRVK
jgi:hypothetical protein